MKPKIIEWLQEAFRRADAAQESADARLPLTGGTVRGTITSITDRGFYHEGDTGLGFSAKNTKNSRKVTLGVGTSGSKGIYDDDTGSWMFHKDSGGNYKIGEDYAVRSVNGASADADGNVNVPVITGVLPYTLPSGGNWAVVRIGWGSDWGRIRIETYAGGTQIQNFDSGSTHQFLAVRMS